jgi:hypothetical protein
MKKQPYMPADENGRFIWLTNFVTKFIAGYYSTLGFVTADSIQLTADLAFITFLLNYKEQLKTKTSDWVAYTKLVSSGMTGVNTTPAIPAMPSLPGTLPTLVPPDVYGRVALVVNRLKAHPNYTPTIGADLGVIGADDATDPNTMKPILTLELQSGRPNVKWAKSGMQGIDFYVDRGSGVFLFLARDTEPDYLDTFALPAAGVSAVWKYKGCYCLHDAPSGQMSDIASISVMGV